MEHPYLFLGKLFELLHLETFAHHYPHVIYSWFVMLFLITCGALAVRRPSLIPTKTQNLFEVIISGIEDFMIEITGEEGRFLFPLIATVFIYIFVCNLLGLIPGFYSPTASINTTLSCALVVVIFTHVVGVYFHGIKYVKHFLGPVWWLSPLIMPIEIIGHLARILSLSIRLFGNIMGEDLVLAILLFLAGAFFAPLPMMFLAIFTSFVQAFIFALLSMMYFAGAMEEAH
nr:F0F1 ATP synthase subunit A [Desulfobacterales bacterium]